MKLVEFLQGKWLGHPVHPAIVHLPVGLWTVACALDLALRAGVAPAGAEQLATYCVGVGLAAIVVAVPTGLADWSSIKRGKPAWKIGLVHLLLNAVAVVVWAVNLGLRLRTGNAGAILLTSLAGTVLVFAGGYLGTRLVFDHGVSVARLSKKKWRNLAIRGGANVPEEKG